MSEQTEEVFFNPLDPQLAVDPFPIFKRFRDIDPVHSVGGGLFVVTGHDEARTALAHKGGDLRWEQFQRARHGDDVVDMPYFVHLAPDVLMKAGEDHRRVRGTFQRNLTAGVVNRMREEFQATADRLVDGFVADGRVELMKAFASPLPLSAISRLLRVPEEDEAKIEHWMHGFKLAIQMLPLSPEDLAFANSGIASLNAYFSGFVAERRANPGDDLVSRMIADADAGLLTEEELVTNVWGLYVGGHDTTSLSIGNAMATLLEHPAELEKLRADPGRIPAAIEEVLRYVTTVQGTHRLFTEELTLGAHTIPPDVPVLVYLAGGNHDERLCPHADAFDLDRPPVPDHLAFGHGPHKCPGRSMARMLLAIAVQTLITRLPGLTLEQLTWDTSAPVFRGPEVLELTWDVPA
jgi:cytochrome P450